VESSSSIRCTLYMLAQGVEACGGGETFLTTVERAAHSPNAAAGWEAGGEGDGVSS
jgi:hypothetical protein